MSRDILGNKQTIIINSCLINYERYDLVITPHGKSVGHIKTKRQTERKKLLTIKNKLLGKDFPNEETRSQKQKQSQYKNFTI